MILLENDTIVRKPCSESKRNYLQDSIGNDEALTNVLRSNDTTRLRLSGSRYLTIIRKRIVNETVLFNLEISNTLNL